MKPYDNRVCELGEGAFWHPSRQQYFWFDILNCRLLSRDSTGPQEWKLDRMASAAGWVSNDRLIIGSETGFALLTIGTNVLENLVSIDAEDSRTRSNDGRADPQGGFWLSMMGKEAEDGLGSIHRFYRGEVRTLVKDMSIPNAICFSSDGTTAYYADTCTRKVWAQELDTKGWPTGDRRLLVDLAPQGLNPDGAVIDSEGSLCIACWGAGRVIRFGVDGRKLDEFPVGGVHSSCPAFGGDDMLDLLVTTAVQGLEDPDAGQGLTYLVRASVPGLPEPQVLL